MSVGIRPVLRKQEKALRQFRQSLFSTDTTGNGWTSSLPAEVLQQQAQAQTVPHRFRPVRSVTDRHAVLTIMGDICGLGCSQLAPRAHV